MTVSIPADVEKHLTPEEKRTWALDGASALVVRDLLTKLAFKTEREARAEEVITQLHRVVKDIDERVRQAMEEMLADGLPEDASARIEAAMHLARITDALVVYAQWKRAPPLAVTFPVSGEAVALFVGQESEEARALEAQNRRATARKADIEIMGTCECDLRDRKWNPNTGRCETCSRFYTESRLSKTNTSNDGE